MGNFPMWLLLEDQNYHTLNKGFEKTGTLANKSTKQNMPHLKLGIVSNFGGIGPENKLFSIFLHDNKITSKKF